MTRQALRLVADPDTALLALFRAEDAAKRELAAIHEQIAVGVGEYNKRRGCWGLRKEAVRLELEG